MKTIDEALTYFRQAEEDGFQVPDSTDLTIMTEEEVILMANYYADKADNYYGGLN